MKFVIPALTTFYHAIMFFLAPPFCAYCRQFLLARDVFCVRCYKRINPIVSHRLSISPSTDLVVHAIADYKEPLKSLILAKGWSNILASHQLGELMWSMTCIKNIEFDYIVPIPLHWTRYAKRGFNQAEEMAKIISQRSGKPVMNLIKRSRRTAFQFTLLSHERASNVSEAFELCVPWFGKKNFLAQHSGKKILLVDDLMTTGATLISVARELRRLHPQAVTALVGCRVV